MTLASNYLENELADHLFTDGAFTPAATLYLALCSEAPVEGDDGSTITEVSYTGYARVAVTASEMGAAAGGVKLNTSALTFPQCTGGSDTATHLAICDASSGGNLYTHAMIASGVLQAYVRSTDNYLYIQNNAFNTNDEVVIASGGTPPSPLDMDTTYHVINSSGDRLQLSLTSGGAAVSITADGFILMGVKQHLAITNNVIPEVPTSSLQLIVT